MDDPWDVKSVRQSGQYISCMKINGVPLLPPVLSKECREEMQYYKLLAREVEKRISILQPYIDSDTDGSDDRTGTSECEPDYGLETENIKADYNINIEKIAAVNNENNMEELSSPLHHTVTEMYDLSYKHMNDTPDNTSKQILLDFSVNMNKTASNIKKASNIDSPSPSIEVPERDYNCIKSKDLLTQTDTVKKNVRCKKPQDTIIEDFVNLSFSLGRDKSMDPFHRNLSLEGPQSLTCKSFTGSLNNIHKLSEININDEPKLVRQSSYTILNPSPQLLAHLEVQSVNLGVDMSCISMSESLSNLSTPGKKRRSWDLESAKVKWSNMALELKQKNLPKPNNTNNSKIVKGQTNKRTPSLSRAKSVAAARIRYASLSAKPTQKTDPVLKTRTFSPVRDTPSDKTIVLEESMPIRHNKEPKSVKTVKETTSPKTLNHKNEAHNHASPKTVKEPFEATSHKKGPQPALPKLQIISKPDNSAAKVEEGDNSASPPPKPTLISESDDPAAKVRELYEKIQKQQHLQMANLVEKQKREQMLLQQAFEEQNNLLFKQLKIICPKSPEEVKEAWVDKMEADRGPVSLSQLMDTKLPEQTFDSPVSSTLTDSNKYINHCDSVLKRSRDISASLKKLGSSQSQNGNKQSPKHQREGCHARTNSPNRKSTPTSRRLNYDTSASSERDYDPILTDRTNDTMADLNVTFPSDSEECRPFSHNSVNYLAGQEVTVIHKSSTSGQSTDSAIKCMEQTIQKSMNSSGPLRSKNVVNCQPTPKQQAAASKIVAYAKGYLVRRLMKTARVQSTVQTIKDALLCALQLHQDREGIRGADVDLHRRLIQQITAACYSLHDTFVASTPSERCAMISADRVRRTSLANRTAPKHRHSDVMSQSHSGVFLPRSKRYSSSSASLMTQSNYETYSSDKPGRSRYMPSPRRRPWR